MQHARFLVIGSGISGLSFALEASKKGEVLLITKKKLIDTNTNYAQGGIAAVLDKTDDIDSHIRDTMEAGAKHNDKKAVRFMVKNSSAAIKRLMKLGVNFEKEMGKFKLAREGGHQRNRIAYVGDYTGREIESILVKRVRENKKITIFENAFALDLITKSKKCYGARIIRRNKIETIYADQTILTTGGIGQIFLHTTNPEIATGDGLAMGLKAKCKTEDLEFIQFHPTALDKNIIPKFLISEALRGENAQLINYRGKRFMVNRHPLAELAPRDIVAREIYRESKKGQVFLDITNHDEKFLKKRFPQIFKKLKSFGINMAKDKIPVTPAAHYICGGIKTDLQGKTNLKNLFAFGEVACTGVHGANRLASNSLLEALVFSQQILKNLKTSKLPKLSPNTETQTNKLNKSDTKKVLNLEKQIKKIMWEDCGIIRDLKKIKNIAIPKMKNILKELEAFTETNQKLAETTNMATVSLAILQAATKRKKSLGCHFVSPALSNIRS